MRISDCSSDVCSSDLFLRPADRFPHLVARNIAEIIIETAPQRAVDILEITVESAAADIGPGRRVIRLDALGVRLGDHRDGVPADHRSGLDALQRPDRSEEHTSELQSLMRISYAVFCLKKKNYTTRNNTYKYP